MDNNLNDLGQKSNIPRAGGLMLSMLKALFGDASTSVSTRDSFQGRLRQHLKENEGVWNQPYKDSKGLLTAGVGINVSTESDFAALPFEKQNPQTKEWEIGHGSGKMDRFPELEHKVNILTLTRNIKRIMLIKLFYHGCFYE